MEDPERRIFDFQHAARSGRAAVSVSYVSEEICNDVDGTGDATAIAHFEDELWIWFCRHREPSVGKDRQKAS